MLPVESQSKLSKVQVMAVAHSNLLQGDFPLDEILEKIFDLTNYGQDFIDKILLQANTEVGSNGV